MNRVLRCVAVAGFLTSSGFAVASECELAGDLSPLYVRGGFNAWEAVDELCYQGEGIYQATLTISELAPSHFKIASEDWASLTCTIDSKYPSEDLDELFSEEAAFPLNLGVAEKIVCFNEEVYKDQGLEVIFTAVRADFELEKSYQLTLDVSAGLENATILVQEQSAE